MTTAVILAGGDGRPAPVSVPLGATVIAADSGLELAAELGLAVDIAVGDFDSVSEATLRAAEEAGVRLERHAAAKDLTDLELALEAAVREGADEVLVLGGLEGRLDHLLGELLLLAGAAYTGIRVDAQLGPAAVHVIRGERALRGEPGEVISLFAAHGAASGVVTEGLVYPLRGEMLVPGSTRGLSNVFAAAEARVSVERGVLLGIRPGGSPTGTAPAGSRGRRPARPGSPA